MNNAINNQFKMKMGSKQKDTEGNFSEKDTALMKKAPLLNISSVLKDDPGAPKDKFKAMGDAFKAGQEEGQVPGRHAQQAAPHRPLRHGAGGRHRARAVA